MVFAACKYFLFKSSANKILIIFFLIFIIGWFNDLNEKFKINDKKYYHIESIKFFGTYPKGYKFKMSSENMKLLFIGLYNSPIKDTLNEVWIHTKWFNVETMRQILNEVGFKNVIINTEFDLFPEK